jgi:CheY-like chemotaxis protein
MITARIVLIEDNPADVFLFEMAMKEHGIQCELIRFATGAEALSVLCPLNEASETLVPDAIFLDLNTPKSDGFQVLTRLQNSPRLALVPIAIITSSTATADRNRSTIRGVRYIEKPSQLNDFLSEVGQAVKQMLLA